MYKLYRTGARTEPCGTPAVTCLGEERSPCTVNLNFLFVKKEPISLMRLIENCNSDSLYTRSRPGCHVVSKAFSMSKNIAAVDICYLNSERRDPLASHLGVSCCDAHGNQTDLRLASFFPKCVYELFLELISQEVCP
jgi:hypothetical protein